MTPMMTMIIWNAQCSKVFHISTKSLSLINQKKRKRIIESERSRERERKEDKKKELCMYEASVHICLRVDDAWDHSAACLYVIDKFCSPLAHWERPECILR